MAEALIPLPSEITDKLQEGCRDCLYARFSLSELLRNEDDPAAEIQRINENCSGWQSKESPQETLINAESGPALAMASSLEVNCPLSLK
jgi:hypothetical protein